jgi:hypothetical protein
MSSAEERSRLASRGTGGRGRSWLGFGFERLDLEDPRLEATDDALDWREWPEMRTWAFVINFSGVAVAVAVVLAGTETEKLRPSWNVDGGDGEVGVRASSSLSFRLIPNRWFPT